LALAGNLYAISGAVENQPMISALDRITGQLAFMQRVAAMATAILKGDRFASFRAEQHYRLIQKNTAERLAANFARQRRNVPAIL
jgi:hypothetical protein